MRCQCSFTSTFYRMLDIRRAPAACFAVNAKAVLLLLRHVLQEARPSGEEATTHQARLKAARIRPSLAVGTSARLGKLLGPSRGVGDGLLHDTDLHGAVVRHLYREVDAA